MKEWTVNGLSIGAQRSPRLSQQVSMEVISEGSARSGTADPPAADAVNKNHSWADERTRVHAVGKQRVVVGARVGAEERAELRARAGHLLLRCSALFRHPAAAGSDLKG